jgi:hypothetical protein
MMVVVMVVVVGRLLVLLTPLVEVGGELGLREGDPLPWGKGTGHKMDKHG